MDPLTVFGACVALAVTAGGATWALRTKLSDIELAIRGHIVEDKANHEAHEARIIQLEGRKARKR